MTPICQLNKQPEISSEPTVSLVPVKSDFSLSNKMTWKLSGFTKILLSINDSMTALHSDYNSSIKSSTVASPPPPLQNNLLSSGKL